MDVEIRIPEIQVVSIPGVSLWENEDGDHIKPKGEKLVHARHIDGLPTPAVNTKAIGFSIAGALIDGYTGLGVLVPFGMYIKKIMLAVDVAPTVDLILDINLNGISLYDTQANRPTIPANETFAIATLPETTLLQEGEKITLDIDQASGEGLALTIVCEVADDIW